MAMIVLTLIVFGILLFLAEVVFDHPYHRFLEGSVSGDVLCPSRRASAREFLAKGLPFVFTLIGLPLLFCNFWQGLVVLALAAASRWASSRL